MPASVSHNIRVSVLARYEPAQSAPGEARFIFSYRITIANYGPHTVQLLARHWVITDSLAPRTEVEGPGVVGVQPVLAPGEQYTYTSFCPLRSGMGRMEGTYRMRDLETGGEFLAEIPPFGLHLPHAAN